MVFLFLPGFFLDFDEKKLSLSQSQAVLFFKKKKMHNLCFRQKHSLCFHKSMVVLLEKRKTQLCFSKKKKGTVCASTREAQPCLRKKHGLCFLEKREKKQPVFQKKSETGTMLPGSDFFFCFLCSFFC